MSKGGMSFRKYRYWLPFVVYYKTPGLTLMYILKVRVDPLICEQVKLFSTQLRCWRTFWKLH